LRQARNRPAVADEAKVAQEMDTQDVAGFHWRSLSDISP
jgi:hypothetical protein